MSSETQDPTIRRLTVVDGKPNTNGDRLLATFDANVSGIRILACVLIERADGTVKVSGPRGKTRYGNETSTHFTDPDLSRAVCRKAAEIYAAFTGRQVFDD